VEVEVAPESPQEEVTEEEFHVFAAPIVGTFYITPKPDAEPFVQVGDKVSQSTVLCIIEAMKIFNQIESDVEGEIVSILVENGQPVEYGEPLFEIRLST
jgi:acetyl-CoA carboxylase biotin carboxyl carrier protein